MVNHYSFYNSYILLFQIIQTPGLWEKDSQTSSGVNLSQAGNSVVQGCSGYCSLSWILTFYMLDLERLYIVKRQLVYDCLYKNVVQSADKTIFQFPILIVIKKIVLKSSIIHIGIIILILMLSYIYFSFFLIVYYWINLYASDIYIATGQGLELKNKETYMFFF